MIEESDFRHLSDDERALFIRLLEEDFPGRTEIVKQLANSKVQTIDPSGSIKIVTTVPTPAPVVARVPVEAEFVDTDGIVVHILLHVVKGYITELELYKEDLSDTVERVDVPNLRVRTNMNDEPVVQGSRIPCQSSGSMTACIGLGWPSSETPQPQGTQSEKDTEKRATL